MTNAAKKIMAVPDADQATAGAIVYWNKNGLMRLDRLTAAWQEAGLDPALLPEMPTPEMALRLACHEQAERHRLVRATKTGFAIVDERDAEVGAIDPLRYAVRVEVTLSSIKRPHFAGTDWSNGTLAQDIITAYDRVLDEVAPSTMSGWLVDQAYRLQGVALRDTGGFYFIPAHRAAEWRAVASAVSSASAFKMYEIPALPSEQAVQAVLDALIAETTDKLNHMTEELNAGISVRAMTARQEKCARMNEKLAAYDALLGDALATIKRQIEDTETNWSEAILAAETEDA
jgi:hypothetical protein